MTQPAWSSSSPPDEHYAREAPLASGDTYLGSHTRMCLSCHDGTLGPRAEQCPRFRMAVRRTTSTTRRMDCGVCHDPHLDNRVEGNAKFLHHEENCSDCHEGRLFDEYVDSRAG